MKQLFALLLISYLALSCNTEPKKEDNTKTTKKNKSPIELNSSQNKSALYPSESGYLKFSISGTMTGEEIWYWADWGKKRRMEVKSTIEIMGIVQNQETVTVILDDKFYSLDDTKGTATMLSSDLAGSMSDMDFNDEELLTQFGGVKKGTKEILGKTCQIWEISEMMANVAVWNGLALETKVDMGIVTTQNLAVEIDLNSSVDSDLFDISDYKIIDMGNVEDIMNGGQ